MKIYFFQGLMRKAFENHPWGASLKSLHQTASGWAGIIKDEKEDQEYLITAVPVKALITVVPETADQLLKQGGI